MAERPTGALHVGDEEGTTGYRVDGTTDTAFEPDPDSNAPEGWRATHYSAGGGVAVDEAGNTVIMDADGSVSTFLADAVDVVD